MTDPFALLPFALLPFAIAAAGGSIDGVPAASDGREALIADPRLPTASLGKCFADNAVRAVLTTGALAALVPAGVVTVLLDDAPYRARFVDAARSIEVALGAHHGLLLEGEVQVTGRDEPCVRFLHPTGGEPPAGTCRTGRTCTYRPVGH